LCCLEHLWIHQSQLFFYENFGSASNKFFTLLPIMASDQFHESNGSVHGSDSSATLDNESDDEMVNVEFAQSHKNIIDLTSEVESLSVPGNSLSISSQGQSSTFEERHDEQGSQGSNAAVPQILDLTEDGDLFTAGNYLTDERLSVFLQDLNRIEHSPPPPVNENQSRDVIVIPEVTISGRVFKPGKSVELLDGKFLRIATVLLNNGEYFLRGQHFVRLVQMGTQFPQWENDLCWVLKETTDGVPLPSDDVAIGQVRQFRTIHLTNSRNVIIDGNGTQGAGYYRRRDLFCRLKEVYVSEVEVAIHYLTPSECDDGFVVSTRLLRAAWRENTQPFGSDSKPREDFPREVIDIDSGSSAPYSDQFFVDLTQPDYQIRLAKNWRRYTFGDGFCGAGGVSCGAEQADLSIKWAFDKDPNAASTYRLNFPRAICETAEIFDFLTNRPRDIKVDVSHGSPPCQTFSPAHTVNCSNDDANSACVFSCWNLVRRVRSRIHTMEETFGLLERHKLTFNGILHDFLENGFSVRYKVSNCMDYGIPQSRRRLVIIAAGYD
jgi:DNA (cytosine-5)-methyltransferase 1